MTSESPLRPTRDEALASLVEIDLVTDRTRKAIAAGVAAPFLILWGAIWLVGFALTQFFPASIERIWTVLDLVGIAVSILLGSLSRKTPVKGPNQRQIGLSWLVLLAYSILWVGLLVPWGHIQWAYVPIMNRRIAAFWSTIPMFGYVIMGIWRLSRFFLWLGLTVTVLTLVGYFALPGYFYLWMAVGGGGALMASGIFIRRCWR